ncbi:DUF2075 domain-containing protein [Cetobacterium somerae]|uniref:DNA/RNA helicase domain-containing protein n=1 Tax=Cetobacterium sp. NK01 TaxID=2993530 RepID=UPI002117116E|nr:DNA/RNA helicase domain-containing protein [Cetobacterium sp. NK01]MCQ8213258.1 DUF2075 domain-containing protein [Cetobacterium sp. NK01]
MKRCFDSDIKKFIEIEQDQWLGEMINNFKLIFAGEFPSNEQVMAWKDCFVKLQKELKKLSSLEGHIIFEYLLPMEGGRRPDVILLLEDKVFILEFKMKKTYSHSDLDQLKGYYRDITGYHRESQKLTVVPFLIITMIEDKKIVIDGRYNICSCNMLVDTLNTLLSGENLNIDPKIWMGSEYSQLPTLINAAIDIFNNNDIKELRSAKSAGIYTALEKLKTISEWTTDDKENKSRSNSISFVTGVPGAGKTLLGLEFIHHSKGGSFLSGNGPLVKVLQYALQSRTFVTDLYKFKSEYTSNSKQPHTNIIVFDEAQRAWDALQNKRYKKSEPQCIIEIADKTAKPCHYLGLIGEGQEIHHGEEQGIKLWREALRSSKKLWYVTCPESLKIYFEGLDNVKIKIIKEFNLDSSLRTHAANEYPKWVKNLLENILDEKLAEKIQENNFNMYITRELGKAKKYCLNRYKDSKYKKYGLLGSSKVYRDKTEKFDPGPWFHDPVSSLNSCCSFKSIATEFDCQGLEIDMPIIYWGEDLLHDENDWIKYTLDTKLQDPHKIRLNSYRVLLTRGRDGVIVYIPKDEKFDETHKFLIKAGMKIL